MRNLVLTREAEAFVRKRCSSKERHEFFQMVQRIRQAPITSSRMITVEWHQYTLRVFRFGGCIAIFNPFIDDQPIMVLKCQRLYPLESDDPDQV